MSIWIYCFFLFVLYLVKNRTNHSQHSVVVGIHLRTSSVIFKTSNTVLLTNDHDKLIGTTFNTYTGVGWLHIRYGKLISLQLTVKKILCLSWRNFRNVLCSYHLISDLWHRTFLHIAGCTKVLNFTISSYQNCTALHTD